MHRVDFECCNIEYTIETNDKSHKCYECKTKFIKKDENVTINKKDVKVAKWEKETK